VGIQPDIPLHGRIVGVGSPGLSHIPECLPLQEIANSFEGPASASLLLPSWTRCPCAADPCKHVGSDDELTKYGGETTRPGTATRQAFPIDDENIELFEELDLKRSLGNIWAISGQWRSNPGTISASNWRHDGSIFRVDFDLSQTVLTPPAPLGWPKLDN